MATENEVFRSDRNDNSCRAGEDVFIIGAGMGGLSTAYELQRRGIAARILDRADSIAAPWRNRSGDMRSRNGV